MKARFKVNMTQKILFNFLLTHAYRSASGIIEVLIGVAALVLGIINLRGGATPTALVLFFFAVYMLAFIPARLYFNAVKQMKLNPAFKEALFYTLDENGITCAQGKQKNEVPWDHIIKVCDTKYSLLLYTGKKYCFILPKESIGAQMQKVMTLIRGHLSAGQIKIKKA